MLTTATELAHALSLMRRTREACAARLAYTKAVWQVERIDPAAPSSTLGARTVAASRPIAEIFPGA